MKMLIVRIEKNNLQIAEVSHRGKIHINKLRLFTLDEELESGGYVNKPEALAEFIAMAIEKGKLSKSKVCLLLDLSAVMLKEYNHEKVKPGARLSLAKLEAEAVLPENEGEFIIENQWYGPRTDKEGLQKSCIFSVSEQFINEIIKALKLRGLKLVAVYPGSVVHTDIIEKLLSPKISGNEFKNKNIVAINLGQHELRICIFKNRVLIHQRVDDIIMDEFYRAVSAAFGVAFEEAEEYALAHGIRENTPSKEINAEAFDFMEQNTMAILTKVARSVRIVLSAENLEADQIILSGSTSAIPGLAEFVTESFGTKCLKIETYEKQISKFIELDEELKERKNLFQRILLLAGIYKNKKKDLNFLTRGIARKRENQRTIFVCTFILIAALLVMSILPLSYYILYKDYQNNMQAVSAPEYVAVQELLDQQRLLASQLNTIEIQRSNLPFGQSNLGTQLEELKTSMFSGSFINTIIFEKNSETFQIVMSADQLDTFIAAKNRVNKIGKFKVSLPLAISQQDGNWQCSVTVTALPWEEK